MTDERLFQMRCPLALKDPYHKKVRRRYKSYCNYKTAVIALGFFDEGGVEYSFTKLFDCFCGN